MSVSDSKKLQGPGGQWMLFVLAAAGAYLFWTNPNDMIGAVMDNPRGDQIARAAVGGIAGMIAYRVLRSLGAALGLWRDA